MKRNMKSQLGVFAAIILMLLSSAAFSREPITGRIVEIDGNATGITDKEGFVRGYCVKMIKEGESTPGDFLCAWAPMKSREDYEARFVGFVAVQNLLSGAYYSQAKVDLYIYDDKTLGGFGTIFSVSLVQ